MNYNFILLNKVIKTNHYINNLLINYNKYYMILRNNTEKTMYELIKIIHSYLIEDSKRIKIKYLKDLVINISMIDYYMGVSYELKCISKRKYTVICKYILEEKKIIYGLIKYEKSNI